MHKDKDFLKELRNGIIDHLKKRGNLASLRLKHTEKIYATNTNGWSVKVGQFYGHGFWAEIWVDKFTKHDSRKVEYCIGSKDFLKIESIVKRASQEYGKPKVITLENIDDGKFFTLSESLPKNRFGQPLLEKYDKYRDYYYGMCEFDEDGLGENEIKRMIQRASDFFLDITRLLKDDESILDEIYP